MKNSLLKKLSISAFVVATICVAAAATNNENDGVSALVDLTKISNASALEGSITCGEAGSGCKFTLNGTPMTSTTHKEAPKKDEEVAP